MKIQVFSLKVPNRKKPRLNRTTSGLLFTRRDTQPILLTNTKLLWTLPVRDEAFRAFELIQGDLHSIFSKLDTLKSNNKEKNTISINHVSSLSSDSRENSIAANNFTPSTGTHNNSINDDNSAGDTVSISSSGDKIKFDEEENSSTLMELLNLGKQFILQCSL